MRESEGLRKRLKMKANRKEVRVKRVSEKRLQGEGRKACKEGRKEGR